MVSPASNPPISQDRIKAYFDSESYKYFIDSDGDLGGNWDGNQFFFFIKGERDEVLYVQSRWQRLLPSEQFQRALDFVNQWNQDHFWPKVFVRTQDDEVAIYTETVLDLEYGVADDQLGQFLTCAIATACQVYDEAKVVFG